MYQVDITGTGDYAFTVKSKDYEFLAGLKGRGVTPADALLASLGTCIGVYIDKYAQGTKIKLNEYNIRVVADFGNERPVCFKNIEVTIDFKGLKFDEERKSSILNFVKNCPVHNTFKANPAVNISIQD